MHTQQTSEDSPAAEYQTVSMFTIKDPTNTKFGMLFRLHPQEYRDRYNAKPKTASEPSTFKQQHAHLSRLFDKINETPSTDQQGSDSETTRTKQPGEKEMVPSSVGEAPDTDMPPKEGSTPLKPPHLDLECMSHMWGSLSSLSAVPRVHFTPVGNASREAVRRYFS